MLDGALLFFSQVGNNCYLCRYDGQNVALVADITCAASGLSPALELIEYNGALYFSNPGGNCGVLCKYDGSLLSVAVDPASVDGALPAFLTVHKGKLYFRMREDLHGYELWSFDGNTATLVEDTNPGPASGFPGWLTGFNGELFFSASDGATGTELHRIGALVADISPWPSDLGPRFLTVFSGILYFATQGGKSGKPGLWRVQPVDRLRARIYVLLVRIFEEWWKWPQAPTEEADTFAFTVGVLAIREGAAPQLVARHRLLLGDEAHAPGLVYESPLLDSRSIPSEMALVVVLFHHASGNLVSTETELVGFQGSPLSIKSQKVLEHRVEEMLGTLTLKRLQGMEIQGLGRRDSGRDERSR